MIEPEGERKCMEVQLVYGTDQGKRYWVECGSLLQPLPWEQGLTNHLVLQWRMATVPAWGTGASVTNRLGCPYSYQYYRVAVQ